MIDQARSAVCSSLVFVKVKDGECKLRLHRCAQSTTTHRSRLLWSSINLYLSNQHHKPHIGLLTGQRIHVLDLASVLCIRTLEQAGGFVARLKIVGISVSSRMEKFPIGVWRWEPRGGGYDLSGVGKWRVLGGRDVAFGI
jgi:hypothetical protein